MLSAFGISWLDKGSFFGSRLSLTLFPLPWSFVDESFSKYALSLCIALNTVILYFISLGLDRLLGTHVWIVPAVVTLAIVVYFFIT